MPEPLKALTVRQPWAWAIARGWKPVENRSWTTSYRGPLAIHAAQQWDDGGVTTLRTVVGLARSQGFDLPPNMSADLPYTDTGLVIATVTLIDICTAAATGNECNCGPWAQPGQTHWRFTDAQPLATPVAAKGRLGLWDFDVTEATRA